MAVPSSYVRLMDPLTRWETEALRRQAGRPRPRSRTVDLRVSSAGREPAPTEPDDPPPGTLLVPLDAWQRMLEQLGNLHEAGQQLAEASARAAKAEVESEFLRERVTELNRQLTDATESAAREGHDASATTSPETAATETETESQSLTAFALTRARALVHDLRARRRH
jgi:hypothetical protein